MPSNVTLNAGAGGAAAVTKQITHDGDVSQLQGVFVMGITGTEDSYTAAAINGDATNGLDCDVTRVIPGTSASHLGKAEDTAHASGDTGVLFLAVRRDTPAVGSDTDGDNSTLNVNSSGRLYVAATVDAAIPAGNNNIGDVDVASLPSIPAGTNNIGDVDVLTLPSIPAGNNNIGDVDISSIAAGDNNIGNVDIATANFTGNVDTAAGATQIGVAALAVRDDALAALTEADGDLTLLRTTSQGSLHVNVDNTVTVGSHAVTNAGTFAVQVDGAALTALQLIDNSSVTDDAAFTPATTGVNVAGFFADETATDSVDEGDAGAARMTLDRKVITTPYAHAAAGGATPYKNLDVDETEDEIKGSPGKLFWIHVINRTASPRYLKFYNDTAANVTVGTTTPVNTFEIPTQGDTNGAGFTQSFGDIGLQFTVAITVAATTGLADNDVGTPGANDVVLNAGYL